jgi:hypothetical protein
MRWTRLDGRPDSYAIDPATHEPSQPDQPWTTALTPRSQHMCTLLAHDLPADPDGQVSFRTDRITAMKAKHAGRGPRPVPRRPADVRGCDTTGPATTIRDPRRR